MRVIGMLLGERHEDWLTDDKAYLTFDDASAKEAAAKVVTMAANQLTKEISLTAMAFALAVPGFNIFAPIAREEQIRSLLLSALELASRPLPSAAVSFAQVSAILNPTSKVRLKIYTQDWTRAVWWCDFTPIFAVIKRYCLATYAILSSDEQVRIMHLNAGVIQR